MEVNFDGVLPITGEIIVVEDEPTLSSIAAEILNEVGLPCVAFTSGDDALVYLLQSHTKCVLAIVDHGLPGQIQGVELAEMIVSKWPDIQVIVTSGWTREHIHLPADVTYLGKPWSLVEMVTAVADLLQPGVPITKISLPSSDD